LEKLVSKGKINKNSSLMPIMIKMVSYNEKEIRYLSFSHLAEHYMNTFSIMHKKLNPNAENELELTEHELRGRPLYKNIDLIKDMLSKLDRFDTEKAKYELFKMQRRFHEKVLYPYVRNPESIKTLVSVLKRGK